MNPGYITLNHKKPFVTESGYTFPELELAYQTWGTLNADRSNAVLICHALTGNSAADEWLEGFFGEGRLLDPAKHFIICINTLGSCYGSTGPRCINPETGRTYGSGFPLVTIRDMVRAQQIVLDELGVREIEFVFGGSMGGMQALEFALMDDRIRQLIVVAMSKAHSPWAIGISEAQRQAIYSDPKWRGGDYPEEDPPVKGLASARMMAMITYRSAHSFHNRFGRSLQKDSSLFEVESYLRYQGGKLVNRFDALTYVRLTQAMDSHDAGRERGGFEKALGKLKIPALVIGIDSDILYPVAEQKELAGLLGNGRYAELKSPDGHDAFLIEFEQMHDIISSFQTGLNRRYRKLVKQTP